MSDGAESKKWIYGPRTRLRGVTAGGGSKVLGGGLRLGQNKGE